MSLTSAWIRIEKKLHSIFESNMGTCRPLDRSQGLNVLFDGTVVPETSIVELEMKERTAGVGDQSKSEELSPLKGLLYLTASG